MAEYAKCVGFSKDMPVLKSVFCSKLPLFLRTEILNTHWNTMWDKTQFWSIKRYQGRALSILHASRNPAQGTKQRPIWKPFIMAICPRKRNILDIIQYIGSTPFFKLSLKLSYLSRFRGIAQIVTKLVGEIEVLFENAKCFQIPTHPLYLTPRFFSNPTCLWQSQAQENNYHRNPNIPTPTYWNSKCSVERGYICRVKC